MNGEARRATAGATDIQNHGEHNESVTDLLAEIRRELDEALADPEEAGDPFWAIVAAGLRGSLSWDQVANATRAIEQQPVGRCQFCGSYALIEKDSGVADLYVCGECHRIWPFPIGYRLPTWRLREILGGSGPEVA